jgi:hypothetical protein
VLISISKARVMLIKFSLASSKWVARFVEDSRRPWKVACLSNRPVACRQDQNDKFPLYPRVLTARVPPHWECNVLVKTRRPPNYVMQNSEKFVIELNINPFCPFEDERDLFRDTTSIRWTFLTNALITPTNIGASR